MRRRPGAHRAASVLILGLAAASLAAGCGASDNGGTLPLPASTTTSGPATGTTLPGGG